MYIKSNIKRCIKMYPVKYPRETMEGLIENLLLEWIKSQSKMPIYKMIEGHARKIAGKMRFQQQLNGNWVYFFKKKNLCGPFILADVQSLIIGANFLNHFNILIDICNKRLLDNTILLSSTETVSSSNSEILSVRSILSILLRTFKTDKKS